METKRILSPIVYCMAKFIICFICIRFYNYIITICMFMLIDIFGIQISIMVSEGDFSTSGWILDLYRTKFYTNIVNTMVCTLNWIRKSRKLIVDNINEVLKDDEVAKCNNFLLLLNCQIFDYVLISYFIFILICIRVGRHDKQWKWCSRVVFFSFLLNLGWWNMDNL